MALHKCMRCNSRRVLNVSGKCADLFTALCESEHVHYDGDVPSKIGIGGGDYLEFKYCADCGQIQYDFPVDLLHLQDFATLRDKDLEESDG